MCVPGDGREHNVEDRPRPALPQRGNSECVAWGWLVMMVESVVAGLVAVEWVGTVYVVATLLGWDKDHGDRGGGWLNFPGHLFLWGFSSESAILPGRSAAGRCQSLPSPLPTGVSSSALVMLCCLGFWQVLTGPAAWLAESRLMIALVPRPVADVLASGRSRSRIEGHPTQKQGG